MRLRSLLFSLLFAGLAVAQPPATPTPTLRPTATPIPTPTPISVADVRVVLKTDKGDIELTIFASKTPITAANFINLAEKKFYDGKTFHRVIPGFMIQGGDPTGTGAGNPGYLFEDEIRPELRFNRAGFLAMANAGRGTNGCQFFITHAPTPHLNDKHTIFGEVTKGMEVVMDIKQGDKIRSIEVLDSSQPLLNALAPRVEQWNKLLRK